MSAKAVNRHPRQPINDRIIFGPSHPVRWQMLVKNGVVPCCVDPDQFIGLGGAPTWSNAVLKKVRTKMGPETQIICMVPDFRFGNGICLNPSALNGTLMRDGFLGIRAEALSDVNDHMMLERGIAGLHHLHRIFGARARYVFWCLFGRQVHDRLSNRHIVNSRYQHPTFNYHEVVSACGDMNIIDLSPLLKMPMHEIRRLYIDTSSHPSQIGYLMLNEIICRELDVPEAYRIAVNTVMAQLSDICEKISARQSRKIILTGQSIWLDTLSAYMGADGAQALADCGVFILPSNQFNRNYELARQAAKLSDCGVIVVSSGGNDLSGKLSQTLGGHPKAWSNIPCLDWEGATEKIIHGRRETPKFTYPSTPQRRGINVVQPNIKPGMVELGILGMPTWSGITHILTLIASGKIDISDMPRSSVPSDANV